MLRAGRGADLLMVDVALDIRDLVAAARRRAHRTCRSSPAASSTDARAAVAAIHAGAKEYIPLPPDPELIAAVLAAVADDTPRTDRPRRGDGARGQARRADRAVRRLGADHRRKRHRQGGDGALRPQPARTAPSAPFISVNCAAIPENLLESELFGHEKGAFTGAVARRIGKFEEANGGTLLLDEISEMDVRLQAKLLRAIQERVIDRVGGTKPVPVDIRIIATSNRNLAEAVRDGHVPRGPALPPQRREPAASRRCASARPTSLELAEHFVEKYADANGVPARPLSARGARARWCATAGPATCASWRTPCTAPCCWPTGDEIGADAHPDAGRRRGSIRRAQPAAVAHAAMAAEAVTRALVGRTVADVERDLILETLEHCLGNRTHAANILGISIRTLRNKLNEYADDGVPIPAPGRRRDARARRRLLRGPLSSRTPTASC